MNRREFLKSIGYAAGASIIPLSSLSKREETTGEQTVPSGNEMIYGELSPRYFVDYSTIKVTTNTVEIFHAE